ncbi:Guanine deaminase [Myotis brandtii]|uniref:Guanine deaminase n=1 Tax=Myotis brandtii TaxID=109478 RepID=S7MX77_MYOBR|nr:Guanine deaminase [Myotis brandtii]
MGQVQQMLLACSVALASSHHRIVFLEEASQQEKLAKEWGFKPCEIRELSQHEFFMPGLVDTHIHAAQYSFAGSNVDLPLLQWLTKYTFPTELKFKNLDFAEEIYTRVVRRTLKNGTTTACYFTTIYTDSSLLLAEITAMSHFHETQHFHPLLERTVPKYQDINYPDVRYAFRVCYTFRVSIFSLSTCFYYFQYSRVKPIVTPRFTLSCSETMLADLGNIAKTHDLHIQSHISENPDEVEAVQKLFPSYKNYTDVYDKNNLLTNKSMSLKSTTALKISEFVQKRKVEMQQKVFRTNSIENLQQGPKGHTLQQVFQGEVLTSHCFVLCQLLETLTLVEMMQCYWKSTPYIWLSSGLLNVLEVLKHDVKIGLGTDVAGGYSPSILDAIRRAVMVSNTISFTKINERSLTLKEVFRLATLGGSQDVAGGYSPSILDAIRRAVMVSNTISFTKINERSLTLKEVFRLATLGGSQALGLDKEIGNFEVGKEFDALLINPKASDSPIDLFSGDFVGDAFIQKFLYLGDDRNIEEVYVGGKQVVPFSSSV